MSKFDALRKARTSADSATQKPEIPAKRKRKGTPPPARRGPGRPRAKRSDPDYIQVTAYIRKDTHTAAKVRMLQEDAGRDFSELIEELLAAWLKGRKGGGNG